jgi:hypothetical protein
MDAIRKKMQSLKGETESLYATIRRFEDQTKEYQRVADQVRHSPLGSGRGYFIQYIQSWLPSPLYF